MTILVLLPAVSTLLILLALRARGLDWTGALLGSSVAFGCLVVASTETLSMLHRLTLVPIAAFWILVGALTFAMHAQRYRSLPTIAGRPTGDLPLWSLAGLVLVLATTALCAGLSGPNNWDSLTYHMSRVAHWVQNKSVEHYSTNIIRQIEMNPGAEFALLQLQILANGDAAANFVQWAAMSGSVAGTAAIAGLLGASPRVQLLTAIITATIPMGILQSSSTQNDYVAAFWLVAFVYFGLCLARQHAWATVLAASASLGLALLTKATAYIYAFPLAVWLGVAFTLKNRRHLILTMLLATSIVLAINAGHFVRNIDLFGSPLSAKSGNYVNEELSGKTLLANALRGAAPHIAVRSGRVNDLIARAYGGVFDVMGIDANDPKTTWKGTSFVFENPPRHEDLAGNFFHILLIIGTALVLLLAPGRKVHQQAHAYALSLLAGFVLFCLILKWQPWHSRLQLPLFVLWSPVVALAVSAVARPKHHGILVTLLLVTSLPYLFTNNTRRLIGADSILLAPRMDTYFANRPTLEQPFRHAVERIVEQDCRNVGLAIGDWEYPLWVLMRTDSRHAFTMRHVEVNNASVALAHPEFHPCAIVRMDRELRPTVELPTAPLPR